MSESARLTRTPAPERRELKTLLEQAKHKRSLRGCPPGSRITFNGKEVWEVQKPGLGLAGFVSESRVLVKMFNSPVVNFEPGHLTVTVLELPE